MVKNEEMKIKLAIGIPNTGTIKTMTAFSLLRALKEFPHEYKIICKEGSILHANREHIVKRAIEEKCTHLLFLDTDMYFESDAIVRLLKRDKDIIGADYNTRAVPTHSTVVNAKKGQLTTCESVATGFLLIKLAVFKKLSHPWFFWESNDKGEVVTGEDYWFNRKAREAGYKIWVDKTIIVKHIGDYAY